MGVDNPPQLLSPLGGIRTGPLWSLVAMPCVVGVGCRVLPAVVPENRTARMRQHSIPPPPSITGWAHLGRILNDQLVGQSCRAEAQDVPRDQLHRHVLNVALVDKRAVAGVKVLKDEAALVVVEFDEGMVVVNV